MALRLSILVPTALAGVITVHGDDLKLPDPRNLPETHAISRVTDQLGHEHQSAHL